MPLGVALACAARPVTRTRVSLAAAPTGARSTRSASMASHRLAWRDLIPGTVVFAMLALVAFVVLKFARVGTVRGDKITIHAPVGSARGVLKGTEVWLAGRRVGRVKDISFLPIDQPPDKRLLVELEISAKHRAQIRRDSFGQIRAGATLIGAPVMFVSVGSPDQPMLADGDTLTTRPQMDAEAIGSRVALASQHFPEIIANVKVLSAQLEGARGSAGALMGDGGMRQLEVVGSRLGAVTRTATGGDGTIGLALRGRAGPMARAQAAMAGADTLRQLLASGETSLGRFRRDSTLLHQVAELRDEISIVRALLGEPKGTAGRAQSDRALWEQLGALQQQLGELMADLKRRPLRYVAF